MTSLRRAFFCAVVCAGIAAAAGCGSAAAVDACSAGRLAGSFTVVPGSAGAGNIVYALGLRNRSKTSCFVSGLPGLRLLGSTGKPLPTHVIPIRPGMGTAVRVVLAPGKTAWASARFSPDVPGVGDHTPGRCEPAAHAIRITLPPAGGTLVAAVEPPTPVCEKGGLQVSVLTARRPTA